MKEPIRKNYPWVIAVIIFLETIVYGGIINSINIYTIPVTEDLSVSRGIYTLTGIPYGILSFLSALVTGFLLRKFGYKRVTLVSLLLTSAGCLGMSVSPGLFGLALGRSLIGIAFGMCFTAGAVWIIKQWFRKHLGLVLGLISMASGLGGSIMSYGLSWLTIHHGWRTALQIESIFPAIIALLYIFVYDRPEMISTVPYGDAQNMTKRLRPENQWAGQTLKELYRQPLFYLMCLATFVSTMCVYVTSTVINPHFQDNGYSRTAAAGFDSTLMLTLAFLKLFMGWVSDRYGAKPVVLICVVSTAVGQWLLADVSDPTLSFLAVVIFSAGLCLTSIVIPLVALPLFGYRGSMEINGIIVSMSALSSLITAPICNFIYDRIGTYSPSFKVAAVLQLSLVAVYLIMFAMANKLRQKELSQNP